MKPTRYKNQRVWIKEMSCDEPYEAVIKSSFRDSGRWYYRCHIDGKIVDIQTNSIEWISPKKAKIYKFRLAAVK